MVVFAVLVLVVVGLVVVVVVVVVLPMTGSGSVQRWAATPPRRCVGVAPSVSRIALRAPLR